MLNRPTVVRVVVLLMTVAAGGCDAYMRVSAVVTDSGGAPLKGAAIVLSTKDDGIDHVSYTDAAGVGEGGLTYGPGSQPRLLTIGITGYKTFTVTLEPNHKYSCTVQLAREIDTNSSSGRCSQ